MHIKASSNYHITIYLDKVTQLNSNIFVPMVIRQDVTKVIAHGVHTDFYSYTPNKDTVIGVNANTNASLNGLVVLQIYSFDISRNYINYIDAKNVVTTATTPLQSVAEFKALAGQECCIRIVHYNSEVAAKEFLLTIFSNVAWTKL